MKYCKHLKKRKNKPYCNLLKQEIPFCRCRECGNKEYRFPVKRKIENNKKSTVFVKNGTFYNRNAQNNQKTVHYSLQNSANTLQKMKKKSNKLAKLERKRKSVFTDDLKHCYLCGKDKEELHEIFAGRNRLNSIKYNLVLPLCHECHSLNQDNPFFNDYWHRTGQEYFEYNIGTRDEFIKIFRRNYLE